MGAHSLRRGHRSISSKQLGVHWGLPSAGGASSGGDLATHSSYGGCGDQKRDVPGDQKGPFSLRCLPTHGIKIWLQPLQGHSSLLPTVPTSNLHSESHPLPGYSSHPKCEFPRPDPGGETNEHSRAGTPILGSQCQQMEAWHPRPPSPRHLCHLPVPSPLSLLPHWSSHPPSWAFCTLYISPLLLLGYPPSPCNLRGTQD